MTTIAGHNFEKPGIDCVCSKTNANDSTQPCGMTRAMLFAATENDIDKMPHSDGYGAGFACFGRLSRTEYNEIQAEKTIHERRVEAMMAAVRELSS